MGEHCELPQQSPGRVPTTNAIWRSFMSNSVSVGYHTNDDGGVCKLTFFNFHDDWETQCIFFRTGA